jgi:putative transcriptional regulator
MTIKELRLRAGLKAEQVAAQLGVVVSTIGNWEQGKTIPRLRLDQFALLCRLYQCSIEELHEAAQESRQRRLATTSKK